MTKELPSPDTLRKLLRYEPETGKLFWRNRPREYFQSDHRWKIWNTRFANKEAFTASNTDGYKNGKVLGHSLKAHRVSWAIQCGSWPEDEIDHIDRDRSNNIWSNLRGSSRTGNNFNKSSRANSSSIFIGVCWYKPAQKWRATIRINQKCVHLGYFASETCAANAYDAAALFHRGDFASLNFPERKTA